MKKNFVLFIWLLPFITFGQSFNTGEPVQTGLSFSNYFEQNCGQWLNQKTLFSTKLRSYSAKIQKDKIAFITSSDQHDFELQFLGLQKNCLPVGLEKRTGKINYLFGKNENNWTTDVPVFSQIEYPEAYQGIDIRLHFKEDWLEYDFIIHPFQNIQQIKIKADGIQQMELDGKGNLLMIRQKDTIVQAAPLAYQEINGKRIVVDCDFKIKGEEISFVVGKYEQALDLVIDPYVVLFSSFFGGEEFDFIRGIEVDSEGFIYLAGHTESADLDTRGSFQEDIAGDRDGFIAKVTPDGNDLVFLTYLGGTDNDWIDDINIDETGHSYVTGTTRSEDFPIVNAFQNELGGETDAFVTKVDPNGGALVFSTYLGGDQRDGGNNIALDSDENVYLSGVTQSSNFPIRDALDATLNSADFFISKLDATGSDLVFSTYIGGEGFESGAQSITAFPNDLAVDLNSNVYFAGTTNSDDFPTTANAIQPNISGEREAFFLKIDATGTNLLYSTFLGGSSFDSGSGIALDQENAVYICGSTNSDDFPVTPDAYQEIFGGVSRDGFIVKLTDELNNNNYNIDFSTYLGGASSDRLNAIAVDSSGNVYVAGHSRSEDLFSFPPPLFPHSANIHDEAILAVLSPNGRQLTFSTFWGGAQEDEIALDLELDHTRAIYFAGWTQALDFPIAPDPASVLQSEYGGGDFDGFFAKLIPDVLEVNYEYAAKLICGRQSDPDDWRLVPGLYGTTINVHNPNNSEARFFKKLALTFPPGDQLPGDILPIAQDYLLYDEALAVDCNDLRQRLFPDGMPAPYIEGYVVIQSEQSLDVTGVYTSAALDAQGQVAGHSSIDVEQIRERSRRIDLGIEKAAISFCENAGDNNAICATLFEIVVTNYSDNDAQNILVSDELSIIGDAGTLLVFVLDDPVEMTPEGSFEIINQTGTNSEIEFRILEIPEGGTARILFWAISAYQMAQGQAIQLVNTASLQSENNDPNTPNNQVTIFTPLN